MRLILMVIHSTVSRKNFKSASTFIEEPDSRAQVTALEENVKEFGVTYFGMSDRRQGMACFLLYAFYLLTPDLTRHRACHWARTRVYSAWYHLCLR